MFEIEGLRIALTGGIPHRRRYEVERQIRDAGGKVASKVTKNTDVLMVGHGAAAGVLELADTHDTPRITPDQLLTLIREGRLDLGDTDEVESLSTTVGDIRSALDAAPSPNVWGELVKELNTCEDARLADAVAYVEGNIAGWPIDERRARWASMYQWKSTEGGRYIGGDMRIAPLDWVNAMLDGESSPKFALARALTLHGTKAKAKRAKALFDVEELSANLRVLDLGRTLRLSKTFFKALAKAENLGKVDTLVFFNWAAGSGEYIATQTSMPNLRSLHLRAGNLEYDLSNETADAIFQADWIGQIETIESAFGINEYAVGSASALPAMHRYSDNLTSLRHLVLTNHLFPDMMEAGFFDQLLTITSHARHPRSTETTLKLLAERRPASLERIDLSQTFDAQQRYPLSDWADALWGIRSDIASLGVPIHLGDKATKKMKDAVGDLLV